MRAQMWSRALVVLSFFSLSVQASPPAAEEPGTRVTIQLAVASGQLPDAEKLVDSLVAAGGEHQIRVRRQQTADQQSLTVDLWASIDPKDRPKPEKDCDLKEHPGEQGTVKKVVKIIRKE
jgi:hypothetical protein